MPLILVGDRLLRWGRDFGNFQKLCLAVWINISQAMVHGGQHGMSRYSTPSACALCSLTHSGAEHRANRWPSRRSDAWRWWPSSRLPSCPEIVPESKLEGPGDGPQMAGLSPWTLVFIKFSPVVFCPIEYKIKGERNPKNNSTPASPHL